VNHFNLQPRHSPAKTEKNHEKTVTIGGSTTEIQTRYLQNTSLDSHSYTT